MKRTSAKKVGMNEAAVSRVQNFGSDAKVESSKKRVNKRQFWSPLCPLAMFHDAQFLDDSVVVICETPGSSYSVFESFEDNAARE